MPFFEVQPNPNPNPSPSPSPDPHPNPHPNPTATPTPDPDPNFNPNQVVPSTCCGWLDDAGTNADGVSGDGPVVCTKAPWCALPLLPVALDAIRKEVDAFNATFSGVLWLHGELDGKLWGNTGDVEAADEYEDNLKSLIWKLRKDTGFAAPVVAFCPRLARETPADQQSPRTRRTVCGAMQNASRSIGGVTALMDEGELTYADVAGLEVYENQQTSLGMPVNQLSHYTAEGLRQLGTRAAEAQLKLCTTHGC